jgi:hypothetical protein
MAMMVGTTGSMPKDIRRGWCQMASPDLVQTVYVQHVPHIDEFALGI